MIKMDDELKEQTKEEQEESQAAVIGRDVDSIPIVEGGLDIDFTKYEGMRFRIASAREVEVIDPYTGPKDSTGKPSYNAESTDLKRQIEIETEPIPKLDDNGQITSDLLTVTKEGKEEHITVRTRLNLKKDLDKDGNVNWVISTAPSAKLWKFMRKLGVDKVSDMKEKLVTLTTVPDLDKVSDRRWLRMVS